MLDKTILGSSGKLMLAVLDKEEEFIVKSFTESISIFKLSGYKLENGSGMVVSHRMVVLNTKNFTTIDRVNQPCYKQKLQNETFHGYCTVRLLKCGF